MATSTGTAMQGISAAIVYTAIDRISEMINTADAAMVRSIDKEINAALRGIPGKPDAADANYRQEYSASSGALAIATSGTRPSTRSRPTASSPTSPCPGCCSTAACWKATTTPA